MVFLLVPMRMVETVAQKVRPKNRRCSPETSLSLEEQGRKDHETRSNRGQVGLYLVLQQSAGIN